jgi:hypothetical protein
VVTADGRHHTFTQFGSGSFTPGVRTHLSRFMLVDPLALSAEAAHLASVGVPGVLGRLTVDRDALLVTPYHRAVNQARELARGQDRHGSCGMGMGETARYALGYPADAPRVADCAAPRTLARSLRRLRDRLADEFGPLEGPSVDDLCDANRAFAEGVAVVDGGYLRRLLRAGPVAFEGAQGILLDEWHGFHPYTTWSTTTFANAEALLAEAGETAVRLGLAGAAHQDAAAGAAGVRRSCAGRLGLAGPVRGGAGRARRAAVVRTDRGGQAYGESWIDTSSRRSAWRCRAPRRSSRSGMRYRSSRSAERCSRRAAWTASRCS